MNGNQLYGDIIIVISNILLLKILLFYCHYYCYFVLDSLCGESLVVVVGLAVDVRSSVIVVVEGKLYHAFKLQQKYK